VLKHELAEPVADSVSPEDVMAQAKALLEELEPANRAQAQMSSRATAWVVASIAGILALIAIETGISYLRGGVDLRAPWMPLWGSLVMGLISVYFSRRPQVTPRVGLVLASLVTASFLVAMGLNGAIAVFGLAMILTFVHIVAPPNVALGASLLVLAASVLTVTQQTAVSPAVSARVLAAACIALLVVQFLARQNRRLSEVAQSVTFRLRTMVEGMGEELRQTRQERDIAAATDAQTGLLNARAFEEALGRQLAALDAATPCALVTLRFERLDEFVTALAPSDQRFFLDLLVTRLAECVGSMDLGRLSKWEFAGLVRAKGAEADFPEQLATQCARLAQPITMGTRTVPLEPRMGVARWPQDGPGADELLHRSAIALVMASDLRNAEPVWFVPRMESVVSDRAQMSQALDRALREDEFELFYQPIVGAQPQPLHKAEALIRWNDPVKGRVSPGDFIPLAESFGKIVPLTNWVLVRAVAQVRAWRQQLDAAFQVSVNLPPAYLEWCADHPAEALEFLSGLQAPTGSIVLEITEGAFLNVTPEVLQVLALLKGMGFEVALDDFGVGYSCFGQLDRLPLDTMKIDKSLVDHIEATPAKRAVCTAIIKIGHELGFRVVAEGVETAGQLSLLAQAGCDFIQGYVIARPMGAGDFQTFAQGWGREGLRSAA